MDKLISILSNYTFQIVALGTGILGMVAGILGVFLTLRRQSLLGDALGHAALPGIVIGFIIAQEKNMAYLMIGATISGLLATWLINLMSGRNTPVKQDSALSLVLSTFFGIGTALLTYVQKFPNASQAGLDQFIFGQATGMLQKDVQSLLIMALFVLIMITLFWKEFKVLSFDNIFAQTLDGPYGVMSALLSFLFVLVIVMGLESVGVVLISALLVNPAIAARLYSDRLSTVMIIAGAIGFVSGVLGTLISSMGRQIPTGATIVVVATTITLLSLLFAPKKGLIARRREMKRKEKELYARLEGGE